MIIEHRIDGDHVVTVERLETIDDYKRAIQDHIDAVARVWPA